MQLPPIKRIHIHWTAGAPGINPKESDSYNAVSQWPHGEVVECVPDEKQIPPLINGAYAAHTLKANSYALGIAIDAMAGAREVPFRKGKYPITPEQVASTVAWVARRCLRYGIEVRRDTVLTHAEVQRTLGVRQNAKWDVVWVPGMERPGNAIKVGDHLRRLVKEEMRAIQEGALKRSQQQAQGFLAVIITAAATAIATVWDKIGGLF